MSPSLSSSVEPCETFEERAESALGAPLTGLSLDTIQVNVGLKCNLACRHCHVESSPKRNEEMTWETMQLVLRAARRSGAHTLDITGGAPEMHPRLREFIDGAVRHGLHVIVRTNLTVMLKPEYDHFPAFFANRDVHLIASLPCYLSGNVDRQRGRYVYQKSIASIQRLNQFGYGRRPGKVLDFVYNPAGPSLPPNERGLEDVYRAYLHDKFGIFFNRLYTITNVPIGRFQRELVSAGEAIKYKRLLRGTFNADTVGELMCRRQIHVGWDGSLYDCDFNFAIGLRAHSAPHIASFDPELLRRRPIVTGEHCFACTAGCGSSCRGALVAS